MIIALVNNKGGVAKTTAVNLAAGLATRTRRVLLVDLDSQASAFFSLGVARADLAPSSAEVLLDGVPIRNAIRPTAVEGLDLLTGSMALANADLALADVKGREHRLAAALAPIRDDYAFILLDCLFRSRWCPSTPWWPRTPSSCRSPLSTWPSRAS